MISLMMSRRLATVLADELQAHVALSALARIGEPRREQVCAALGVDVERILVLLAFSGIAGRPVPTNLPRDRGFVCLVDGPSKEQRSDIVSIQGLGWSFPDLMRSVGAVVTKRGYGTIAEATCNGVRVLHVRPGDWAEEKHIVDWLQHHAVCGELELKDLAGDQLLPSLRALVAQPATSGRPATGGPEAADAHATVWRCREPDGGG